MFSKIKNKLKKYNEILALSILVLITIISTSYYNFTKQKINNNYKDLINNIYFKKTANYFFDSFEPKFKKIIHMVNTGETFDNILKQYSINNDEIADIKNKISKKINLNKLNTNQKFILR